VFSGRGFYRRGLLFAATWEGQFSFRTRQGRHWICEAVDRELLGCPTRLSCCPRDPRQARSRIGGCRYGKRGAGAAHRAK
jgi:hypothetical protein